MQILDPAFSLNSFHERLRTSKQSVLMLDFDGTLAPFSVNRLDVHLYPEVSRVLSEISLKTNTRIVMISGRAASEVRTLLAPLCPEVWGSHGLECVNPDGSSEKPQLPESVLEAFECAMSDLEREHIEQFAEMKFGCIAVHWRGMSATLREELRTTVLRLWKPLTMSGGLVIQEFDGGIELRLRDRGKGGVVSLLLQEKPPGAPAAYLGDDLTDEDAFEAIQKDGLGILVRTQLRATKAKGWIRPPEELVEFLTEWLRISGGAG